MHDRQDMSTHVVYTLDMFMVFCWAILTLALSPLERRGNSVKSLRRKCDMEKAQYTISPPPSQLRILAFALLPSPFNENAYITTTFESMKQTMGKYDTCIKLFERK